MNSISIPILLMSTIALYVGCYHLVLYILKRDNNENLLFAFACFSVSVYDIMCAGLYHFNSNSLHLFWQKGQFFCMASIGLFLFLFTYRLIEKKYDWIVKTYSILSALLILSGIIFNNHLFNFADPIIRTIHFIKFSTTFYEARPDILMNILFIILLIGLGFTFYLFINALIKKGRKNLLPMIIGFSIFYVSAIMDILTALNIISFVYTGEYSFILIILMMDYTLLRRFVTAFSETKNMNILLEEKVTARTLKIQTLADELCLKNSQLEEKNQLLAELAERDSLTKLLNHMAFQKRLAEIFNLCRRHLFPVSILMMDIDHFKNINDNYGHLVGDHVIRSVAEILISSSRNYDVKARYQNEAAPTLRNYDVAGRYGGDEFVIILTYCDKKEASIVAERISQRIKNIIVEESLDIHITTSMGVIVLENPSLCDQEKKLIQKADRALYTAKNNGRNQIVIEVYS